MKKMAGHVQPTNLDQAIGASARVTEDIDDDAGTGAVYVKGKMWTARSSSGATIPIGTEVTVERIEGVKLYVTPGPCGGAPWIRKSVWRLLRSERHG